jgi:peroxiredoxin
MPIAVGDTLPEGTLTHMTAEGPKPITTGELFAGKKVVVFGVPGAFTPTCSKQHLPGYVKEADAIKAKGVDTIACLAVNDVHVMHAWAEANAAADKILMLADGNASYVQALGLDVDLSDAGMGRRSRRFSMIVDDGVVKELNVEPARGVSVSGADATACRL